ncbi:hypothetical protein EV200_10724 [Pedobacter psychrotolerans]|uniref:Sulfotransferase family protein n=1 Tax=Pedobacter psychrotolerans TaxID=1843235 RepID=A0A4R2H6L7_9SPHI|nr:hypothetical protein [Pedobacter psychrotolerans]TCO21435.1 hypothetical protein EV200_10724 [Pedobacter psychrotolerans]GGE38633.1 hypothetical protein GCM10011413_00220 [Pedobacter psychrotolerans]
MKGLSDWIPYKINLLDNQWQVEWLDLGNHHIAEPFFDETIAIRRARMHERSVFRSVSDLNFMLEASENIEAVPLKGLIFHVSRCGSTLLSQVLSTAEENIVYAEAPLIDQILRAHENDISFDTEKVKLYLKSAVKLLGQKRNTEYQNMFIKLDSWHIHHYSILRACYPDIPFFFISREPAAVIASHQRRPGIHMVPGLVDANLLNVPYRDEFNAHSGLYTAEVLREFYIKLSAIWQEKHELNYFFDYGSGVEKMVDHFFKSINLPLPMNTRITERLTRHSKYPDQLFQPEKPVDKVSYPEVEKAYATFMNHFSR